MAQYRLEYSIATRNRSEIMKNLGDRNIVNWHIINVSSKNMISNFTKHSSRSVFTIASYFELNVVFKKDTNLMIDWCTKNIGCCGRLGNWYYDRNIFSCDIHFVNESDAIAFQLMFG